MWRFSAVSAMEGEEKRTFNLGRRDSEPHTD
jgi:hypothetical protein